MQKNYKKTAITIKQTMSLMMLQKKHKIVKNSVTYAKVSKSLHISACALCKLGTAIIVEKYM